MSNEEREQLEMKALHGQAKARNDFRALSVALQFAGEKLLAIGEVLSHADCIPEYAQVKTLLGSDALKDIPFLDGEKLAALLREYESARETLITRNAQVRLLKLD